MRLFVPALALLLCLASPRAAPAFCGFYVSGADASLVNRATHVALMRAGTRTVLSMQNAYEGPPQDFALVVPVPVVLQKEQVKTLPREVLDHVDHLGSPRLVEYWEQDPCSGGAGIAFGGTGVGFGSGHGRLGGRHKSEAPEVKIEAQFEVGEYEIVILSATDSTALDTWLRQNGYKIPAGAEPHLRPYVQSGMKFFVAKVNIQKVQMKDGRALLSPLRFHYDSETFALPIRLGLINAGDAQDLVVSILSQGKRYEVANYPNVTIPTNLDVSEQTRTSFASFYAALFDETSKQKPGAVVTEYSWDAGTCDPCPGPVLSGTDLATLGADVLPEDQLPGGVASGPMRVQLETPKVSGRLPPEVIQRIGRQNLGRFRLCHDQGRQRNPKLQGHVSIKYTIDRTGAVSVASDAGSTLTDRAAIECAVRAVRGLSFPQPEGGVVSVTQKITFTPGSAGRRTTGVVLTRLHMRYSSNALGEDLVFKEAQAITGGREVRGPDGRLEQGAVLADVNNFQARYAIRHPWTGPIACDNPVRGRWGGPLDGADPGAQAARDLAFVPRGAGVGAFLLSPLPPVSGPTAPSAAPTVAPSSSAPPPAPSSSAPPSASDQPGTSGSAGCGCATESEGAYPGWLAAAVLTGLLRRRRAARKARAASTPP